ncbi:MAG: tRNA (adenosine(37)-N6)-dimethylallyltransferase MiaA [Dehalococcoidia bacterium]|nr:MAG: tRNA (adenosine(37)-N6)-dimethylallyltransferase MiaA [Dehalococcoidia bacterium]
MNHLVAIVGPTAVGKSRLAIHLAQTFNGEIVGADSRQVYRYMDIGTAKPSPEELSLIPHHLVNIVNPDEDFSLAQYQQLAYRAIEDIQRRNKLALLIGGSGQYVWSVLEGWGIPPVPPNLEFRHSLEEKAAKVGKDKLYQELMKVDPIAAQRIDRHNVRRVIRALEVHRGTETPLPQLQHKKSPLFNALTIGLTTDRGELYRRIDLRVDQMVGQGLVAEVEKLVNMGYDLNLPAMSGIGYKQIGMFLKGELTLAAAIEQIKFETHRFVRHQYTWFQLKDGRIKWFDIQSKTDSEITTLLAKSIVGE